MKILVTGSNGFVGKNLVCELKNRGYQDLYLYDIDSDTSLLDQYTSDCSFVFHLAGVNRPNEQKEFMEGNFGFTNTLLDALRKHNNKAPIVVSSSIQAELDNPYGQSKKAGEELLFTYAAESGVDIYMFRLPNVFGKWCRPNYNSAIATFCYNIARDIPVTINDPNVVINLVYIDDVIDSFINALTRDVLVEGKYCKVPTVHTIKLGKIVDLLYSFRKSRTDLSIPNMGNSFEKVLYSTYLSYLPEDQFSYPLQMNVDNRGSFTEIFRTAERGQFSVNISKPGITKGNHWHHTKNEKFLVVSGGGVIQFRKVGTDRVIKYYLSGEKLEVVDIPPGYTHNIINEGEEVLVTLMWANEPYNPEKPDTIFEKV